MTALRKKSRPRPASAISARWTGGVRAVRGQRADERRANELRLFGIQRREQRWRDSAGSGCLLEPPVGDLADTVVAVCQQRRASMRARAGIVERDQQHQRAVADKLDPCADERRAEARERPRRPAARRIIRAAFIRVA